MAKSQFVMIQPSALYPLGFAQTRRSLTLKKVLCYSSLVWMMLGAWRRRTNRSWWHDCSLQAHLPLEKDQNPKEAAAAMRREANLSCISVVSVGTWGDQVQLLCTFSFGQMAWKPLFMTATLGLNSEMCFFHDACRHGISPWPHEGSIRDSHQETQRQCGMGRGMDIVRHPGIIIVLAEEGNCRTVVPWFPSYLWGKHRITSLSESHDVL